MEGEHASTTVGGGVGDTDSMCKRHKSATSDAAGSAPDSDNDNRRSPSPTRHGAQPPTSQPPLATAWHAVVYAQQHAAGWLRAHTTTRRTALLLLWLVTALALPGAMLWIIDNTAYSPVWIKAVVVLLVGAAGKICVAVHATVRRHWAV